MSLSKSVRPQELGIISTRISLKASKRKIVVGESVTFEGNLQWFLAPWWWYGLDGALVRLVVDETVVVEGNTSVDGYFSFIVTFDVAGRYVVKAFYPGIIYVYDPAESPHIEITVLTEEEEEEEEEERRWWLMVGGIAAVVVIGGGILYAITRPS